MLRNLLLTLGIILTANLLVFSQSGALKGKVIDKETGEPIPFANIVVENGGTMVGGATSDFDGNYTIKPIDPGSYDIKATFVGYKPLMIRSVVIGADQIRFYNVKMESTAVALEEFEVIDYKVPLISKDKTTSGGTVTSDEIAKMPNRSANAIASTIGGVFSADGERGSVRGQRSEGTVMYIDGIRVRGSSSLPESAIEQVNVILGGVPAQYGDAVGGIINVTTKGPSRQFGGGVELQTSQFLDNFGYNRVSVNLRGPLLKKKDTINNTETALLGYFLAGEAKYNGDGRPSGIGIYRAKDATLDYLRSNPLRPAGGENGTYNNGAFVRSGDLEHVKSTENTSNYGFNLSGKIDVKTTDNTNLTLGGSANYSHSNEYSLGNSLFNYDKNALRTEQSYRGFVRFTHRFPLAKDSKSFIKNVYYTLQADYTHTSYEQMDPDHKDNLFNYYYLGKFTTHKERSYEEGYDPIAGLNGMLQNNWRDTKIEFDRSELNPYLANYNDYVMGLLGPNMNYNNLDEFQSMGGLANGKSPDNIGGYWSAPGAITTAYGKGSSDQLGINAHFSADMGNHAVQFGVQYQQYTSRYSWFYPNRFWSVMQGSSNAHIEQLDKNNPHPVYVDGIFNGMINYDRIYDAGSQRVFDKSLREAMNLPVNGTDWVDVDSYDPDALTMNYYDADGNMHVGKLQKPLSTDMFSADEMLNNGNVLGQYSGYDYTGKKLTSKPSLDDFFSATDDKGNLTRPIAPFQPIYMAGYIQDKFSFDDLIFNVGVRVDRFDGNQSVLKDPYTLYPALSVADYQSQRNKAAGIEMGETPGNIGNDYVVYVNDASNPTSIMGYRFEDQWYTADGTLTTDPEKNLDAGNGVAPLLTEDNRVNPKLSTKSFKDYEPQWSVMPRISFSFPISEEALFYAHYDVLTQRPTGGFQLDPVAYYFLDVQGTSSIANPNLKPQKTVDYELGFQQKISNTSSMTLTSYYKEMRDQIQSFRYTAAYPRTYYSYNNIDFGTVLGFTATYDLRRTKNVRLRASYTLQFANGTGSDSETSKALITSGQPNLRTLIPLSSDRRHSFNLSLDYRYGSGKEYNGPVTRKEKADGSVKSIEWLADAGFNLAVFGGSGTPYTRSSKIYPIGGQGIIDGSINGSRLPWNFRLDLRVDKSFSFKLNKKDGDKARYADMNVYLQVINLLDSQNIMRVYDATGNADDDGFLSAPQYQAQINQQLDPQSYRDLYTVRMMNPGNYSQPRQIRMGVTFDF